VFVQTARIRETFIHELSIQYYTIVYPAGLRDKRKQPNPQGVSCSINCILPTGKSSTKHQFENVYFICSIDASMAFILTTFYWLYLHWCILNVYSLYFVLSLHTHESDWINSDWNTNEETRNIFIHIFFVS